MDSPLSIIECYRYQCEKFFGIYQHKAYVMLKTSNYHFTGRTFVKFSVLYEEYSLRIRHIAESMHDIFADTVIGKAIRKTFLRFSIRFSGLWEKLKNDSQS